MSNVEDIGRLSRLAGQRLASSTIAARNSALQAIAIELKSQSAAITAANARDLEAANVAGLDGAIVKRLILDKKKVADLVKGLEDVIGLADPLGNVSLARELSDGLELRRLSCPIGVLAIIFESRPEAVIQIASLAIKSGNAVILKGGKEALNSNKILVDLIRSALASVATAGNGITADCVQLVSTRDEVAALLHLDKYIDLVIPRGSNQLVKDIKATTRIPVLGHADGICHLYVDVDADVVKAAPIVVDSKTQYPAACNAAETLLVHKSAVSTALPAIAAGLLRAGVTLHADGTCAPVLRDTLSRLHAEASSGASFSTAAATAGATPFGAVVDAVDSDWGMEWLGHEMSVAAVADVRSAVEWINEHGSHHTDCIITENSGTASFFLANVDSAGVYHNASTRFADGFRYGFGAEVGISTNRVHARGPVGLEGLVTYKYTLVGGGHCVAQFAASKGSSTVTVAGKVLPTLSFTHRSLPQ